MRTLSICALLVCVLGQAFAAAADPIATLRFSDGKTRTLADFPKQSVVMVYFCGHCPTAAAHLGKRVKALYDFIEAQKVPVTLVLATPDFPPPEVVALNKDRSYHMDNALWANDPVNTENISLNNVIQEFVYGSDHHPYNQLNFSSPDTAFTAFFTSKQAGEFRYPIGELGDPRAKEMWWMVERQRPDAVKMLLAAAKTKSTAQADLQKIVDTVKEALTARETALVAAPADMATYEALEGLLAEAENLELKGAVARYKELTKDKALKNELDARLAWRKCQEALGSPRTDVQAAGKSGLAAIAKKYPETVYGRRCADAK